MASFTPTRRDIWKAVPLAVLGVIGGRTGGTSVDERTTEDVLEEYDANDNDKIDSPEVLTAFRDWRAGDLGDQEFQTVIEYWSTQETWLEQQRTYRLVNSRVRTLDPIEATDTASRRVIAQIFEGLMHYPNGETTVQQRLAKDYEIADDDVTYTFYLKEGVTYSNGDEVTASDFVYAWERLAASDNSSRKSFILDDLGIKHETVTRYDTEEYEPGSLAVSAPDRYTLQFELEEPFHATLSLLAYSAFAAIPEGIVDDIDGYDGEMSQESFSTRNPIGSGPFSLEYWKAKEMKLNARPMDEYETMEGPYVEGIHWRIPDLTNALYTYATLSEKADHPDVPSSKYSLDKESIEGMDARGREYGSYGPLETGRTVTFYKTPEAITLYLGFNVDNVEKPIRQAFAYVYNQKEVVDRIYKGCAREAFFLTPPMIFPGGAENYTRTAKEEYPYGFNETIMDEAKQVMEEAGYGPDNRAKLRMTTYHSSEYEKIATLMRDKLETAYVDLEYEQEAFATLIDRIEAGAVQCYSLGRAADYPAPDDFVKCLVPEFSQTNDDNSVSGFNWGTSDDEDGDGWSDAARRAQNAWDEKIARSPSDETTRSDGYLTIEKASWEDAVIVPTIHHIKFHYRYPWVDKPRTGAMGRSRETLNRVRIEDRSQYK